MLHLPTAQPPKAAADLALARLAREQNDVVSAQQLRALGLTSGAVTTRVRRGQLHRIHRGVYAVGSGALSIRGAFTAAVLTCGHDAVLAHHAAGSWHEMRPWAPRSIDVIVRRGGGRRQRPGIRLHHPRWLDPRDVWRRDNILVTSPARTVLDLAGELPAKALRRMVRQSLADGRVSIRQLVEILDRSRRHPGAAALRAVVADGYVPTRSELEDRALDLFAAAGMTAPEVNAPLVLEGRRILPDLLWRERNIVVELDGAAWHADPLSRVDDADRQALLEAHGYRVLRVSWRQLVDHPSQTIARIRSALGD